MVLSRRPQPPISTRAPETPETVTFTERRDTIKCMFGHDFRVGEITMETLYLHIQIIGVKQFLKIVAIGMVGSSVAVIAFGQRVAKEKNVRGVIHVEEKEMNVARYFATLYKQLAKWLGPNFGANTPFLDQAWLGPYLPALKGV